MKAEHGTKRSIEFDRMVRDPAAYFAHPIDVAEDSELSVDEKVCLLRHWEEDARSLAVAEEENMGGGEPSLLSSVLAALGSLGAGQNPVRSHQSRH